MKSVWVGVYVKSCTQFKIIEKYNLELKNLLKNRVSEFLVPSYKIMDNDCFVIPNILFLKIDIDNNNLEHQINEMFEEWKKLDNRILYPLKLFIKNTSKVVTIPEFEIRKFQKKLKQLSEKKINMNIKEGNKVEIISGSFKGFRGIVEEVKDDKLIIKIFIFNREIKINIPQSLVVVINDENSKN